MSFFTKRYLESILANDLIVDSSKIKEIRTWLLGHKLHFQAIVRIWFKELVKSSNDKKLAFMYLAYEVIWHSIKDCPEFVKEFGMYMEKVFGHLVTVNFDEKAIGNIGVFIKIWRKRRIFDEEIQGAIEKIWKARSVNDTIVVKELRKEKGCVNELPPHLTCSVCSGLLKEPVQLPCCKTSLCKLCAFAKLEQHSTCWFGFCPKSVLVRKDEVNLSPELAIQVDLWKAQNKERFKENSPVMDLEAQKNVGQQINTSTKIEYIEANCEFEEKYKKRSRESAYRDIRPKADPLDLNKLLAVPSENLSKPINNNLKNDKANFDLAQIKNEDFNRNGKNCNGIVGKREISIKGGEKGDIEVQKNFNGRIGKEKCEPQKSAWKLDGNVAEQKGHSCNNHWLCDKNSNAGCLLQWINPSGEEKEQCTVSSKDSPMRKAMKRRILCGEEVFEKKSKMCKQNVEGNREASGRIIDEASSKEKKLVNSMRTEWVKVCVDEIEEPVNIGTEHDGTLLFSSITSQFPGTTGLKYRNPRTNCFHSVRLHNNNFFPPKEGWTGIKFVCEVMRATTNDARTFATKYGFNERFSKDKRTHVFYHVEKMMKVDFMPKSSTLRVWKRGFKELYVKKIQPAVMEQYFMFPEKVKLEILVPGSKKDKKVTGNKAEDGITKLERPLCKTNNDKSKNVCFLTFDREEVTRKLVKEGACKRVTDQMERGGFGARGVFGGGWGYGDPYAGYREYGGGYRDPYARYGGPYAGGYGGPYARHAGGYGDPYAGY